MLGLHSGPGITNMWYNKYIFQRIERWWGYLRQARADFWINEFKVFYCVSRIIKVDVSVKIICNEGIQ